MKALGSNTIVLINENTKSLDAILVFDIKTLPPQNVILFCFWRIFPIDIKQLHYVMSTLWMMQKQNFKGTKKMYNFHFSKIALFLHCNECRFKFCWIMIKGSVLECFWVVCNKTFQFPFIVWDLFIHSTSSENLRILLKISF